MKELIIEEFYTPNCSRRGNKPIEYIVVHYTACLADARCVAKSMVRNKRSTHYIVDDKRVIHCVDEAEKYAWHCATYEKKNVLRRSK